MIICPHCEKEHESKYHGNAVTNCEMYGDKWFVFRCSHCKGFYTVHMVRKVEVALVTKRDDGTVEDLSWGEG